MLSEQPLLPSPSGFKRFFSIHPATPREGLAIRGLGIRELMPAGFIHRPGGTGDYLFMVFHDAASVGKSRRDAVLSPPDTAMIWAPGTDQFYGNAQTRFHHSWLHASGPRARAMIAAARIPLGRPFIAPDVAQFLQCLSHLFQELACQSRPDFRILGNVLENYLRETGRALRGEATLESPLLAVRRKIDAGAYHMSLAQLAESAGMPVTTFSARFRKGFGLSPKAYLIQSRLSHAALLLRDLNLKVGEIGAQVGYDDPFHFSKIFKKNFRLSPAEWRRQRQVRRKR